ncbi:E3 ubiquitin-protein ligase RNF10-like isoform X2 [Corticium candelabrum]|uniref:E3 ubiquitin-protein ligase RNF10-like isoform X2 n=1 Tax=Corticium candelabrum TaxID=121492 RepID=UPI002E254618|nr:E3 ubiquitin-protein ligase RNF10-like isoform X2 [Corticium candelabrum]
MRRRSSRMSEQKAIVGDQYGNSQRQVQPLRSKTDERKEYKHNGKNTSFPHDFSRSDHSGAYSRNRGHQGQSGRRYGSDQRLDTQWHAKEKKSGRPRTVDIVPALSGKKSGVVSLNHLLNFTFVPRDTSSVTPYRPKQSMSRSGMTYNKEQFLQANCQFIVQEKGDYTIHAADPDLLVDWSLVEQVRLLCREMPSCPICLYPPTAAKITRCGHVYCWACLLHYLALSEKNWRKCPICYEAVRQEDLKSWHYAVFSVVALSTQPFAVGDVITMKLMERQRGSVVTVPRSQKDERDSCQPQNVEDGLTTQFGKLLTISPKQTLEKIISDEEQQLQCKLSNMKAKEDDNPCFVEAALQLLEERELALPAIGAEQEEVEHSFEGLSNYVTILTSTTTASGLESWKEQEQTSQQKSPWFGVCSTQFQQMENYEAAFSGSEEEENDKQRSGDPSRKEEAAKLDNESDKERGLEVDDDLVAKAIPPVAESSPPNPTYYFYQSSDGQHLYLHPINAKCLMADYGTRRDCPDVITGRIVEMEQMTQSELVRKRYRFLSHLPLSCQFVLCELELQSPRVSRASLEEYASELLKRKQARRKKTRDEQNRDRHQEIRKKTQPVVSDVCEIMSQRQQISESSRRGLDPTATEFVSGADSHKSTSGESQLDLDSDELSPPSFAQALSGGIDKFSPPNWPMRRQSTQSVVLPKESSLDQNDSDGEASCIPTFQDSFFEALSSSDVSVSKSHVSHKSDAETQKSSKKGRTKQLLFTTGGQRRY